MDRRGFIKNTMRAAAGTALAGMPVISQAGTETYQTDLWVAKNGTPAENTRKAIKAAGGMEKFVKKGQKVFIKPNCISTSKPETAINTNPDVVAEVVRLCMKAGAGEVLYMAHDGEAAWEGNGIGAALEAMGAKKAGANSIDQYVDVRLPRGLILRETKMIRELMEYDVFINIPVAKHHAGAQLTLSMKNYMGLNWDRVIMHRSDLHQTIADLNTARPADLIVMDATRMLLTNGPGGPGMVREEKTVVVSSDPVAVDAYTAALFKLDPRSVKHIQCAYEMGLGEIDERKMRIGVFDLA